MLAQNFKTAEDLQVTEQAHAALIKVLHLLDCGDLKHCKLEKGPESDSFFQPKHVENAFNMSSFECGTVRCIGGWVLHFLVGKHQVNAAKAGNNELHYLFYPPNHVGYNDITTTQAACALRSYLTTGKAEWEEALKLA
jgi:hypothetical protein